MKEGKLPIMEIFGPTIQGEGIMTGTVTHFLRTGGCGLRCSWCDSLYAVEPAQIRAGRIMMTTPEILDAIESLPNAPYITFTGGDPCLHERLGDIILTLNMRGMKIAVETQGQLFPLWLKACDVVTFSPKGPSSGNVVDYHILADMIENMWGFGRRSTRICIKVVCFSDQDFEYALKVYRCMDSRLYDAFYFTAGTDMFLDFEKPDPEDREAVLTRSYERISAVLECQQTLAEAMLKETATTHFNEKGNQGCQKNLLLWHEKDKGV